MGVFLPVLRTSFSVRLYAAFMRAYAAYRRPQNIEFHSIRQKKHPFTCVCAVFVVSLQPILYSRMDLTACNLVKRMLKLVPQEQTVTCGYFFLITMLLCTIYLHQNLFRKDTQTK